MIRRLASAAFALAIGLSLNVPARAQPPGLTLLNTLGQPYILCGSESSASPFYGSATTFVLVDPSGHAYVPSCSGGGGSPGGSNTQVQYNSSGSFAGSANFTWNGTALGLGVSGTLGDLTLGNATSGTLTLAPVTGALGTVTASFPANTGVVDELNLAQTFTAAKTFTNSDFLLLGSSTGATTFTSANASSTAYTITVPAATDTLATLAATQTLTNKTISGSSNTLSAVALSSLASQAANTIVMNATGSSASPLAVAVSAAVQADLAASTTFTVAGTGCTPSAHAGGPFAGTVTLAATCTAIVITFNGATGFTAPNGYSCAVGDRTALLAGTFIPSWSEDASTTTTATIPIPAAVGATDVISFHCDYF